MSAKGIAARSVGLAKGDGPSTLPPEGSGIAFRFDVTPPLGTLSKPSSIVHKHRRNFNHGIR